MSRERLVRVDGSVEWDAVADVIADEATGKNGRNGSRSEMRRLGGAALKYRTRRVLNVLEAENLVTNRPFLDPSSWDWKPAIQSVFDSAKAGDTVYIPAGVYPVSSEIVLSKSGVRLHADGYIAPFGSYSDYLVSINGEGVPSRYQTWPPRIDIERLRLDGMKQSRGLFVNKLSHFEMANIVIERTRGTGLKVLGCIESDFRGVSFEACNSGNEPNLDLTDFVSGDPNNNIRFYGLNIPYEGGQAIKLDSGSFGPVRNIFFYGPQIHYLDPDRPRDWSPVVPTIKLIEILQAERVSFIGGNLRGGGGPTTVISLGDATKKAQRVSFLGCTITGGQDAIGIDAVNALEINHAGVFFVFSQTSTPIRDPGGVVKGASQSSTPVASVSAGLGTDTFTFGAGGLAGWIIPPEEQPFRSTFGTAAEGTTQKEQDLTNAARVRLNCWVGAASSAGAYLKVQYSTNNGVSWANLLSVNLSTTARTFVGSGWTDIPEAARTNVRLRLLGGGGDGSTNASFGNISLEVEASGVPRTGLGSPENVVQAPVGSLYTNRSGGPGSTLYVKESGGGPSGWRAV